MKISFTTRTTCKSKGAIPPLRISSACQETFEDYWLSEYVDEDMKVFHVGGTEVALRCCFRLVLFPVSSLADAEALYQSFFGVDWGAAIRSTILLGPTDNQMAIGEVEAGRLMRQQFQTPQQLTRGCC